MGLLKRSRKRPLLVVILGAGPAGLFAAQAAYDTGNVVRIYARGERSPLYGAQYLHQPIPNLTLPGALERRTVNYKLEGTVEGYRHKVYGEFDDIQVSPQILSGPQYAWDIRATYEKAWERFSSLITPTVIDPVWLDTQARLEVADLIVWTIPLPQICIAGHGFSSRQVWAQGDAPALGRVCSVQVEPWTVVANGSRSPGWYRASNVFGHRTAEWPFGNKPPVDGLSLVRKPIATNCNCFKELGGIEVLRVGRYGTWTKGILSHDAYYGVKAKLLAMAS